MKGEWKREKRDSEQVGSSKGFWCCDVESTDAQIEQT